MTTPGTDTPTTDLEQGPVDGALLRRARLEANLSESAAADHAGITPATLRLLEERGGHGRVGVTVPQLQRLVARLGLTLPDVWRSEPPATVTAGSAADARTLGARLHQRGKAVRLTSVARALGWTTERAEAAADALRAAADATGAAVVRADGAIGFAPALDHGNDEALAAVQRHADHARGMDAGEAAHAARVLAAHHARPGDGTRPRILDETDRHRMAALLRKKIVHCGTDGKYRPSADLVEAVWDD